MAPGLRRRPERRSTDRVRPDQTQWRELAILRPGQEVVVLNLSDGGALVESDARMSPGTRTELQLFGLARRGVRGRIDRCHVAALTPLRYRGVIVFDERLDLRGAAGPGS